MNKLVVVIAIGTFFLSCSCRKVVKKDVPIECLTEQAVRVIDDSFLTEFLEAGDTIMLGEVDSLAMKTTISWFRDDVGKKYDGNYYWVQLADSLIDNHRPVRTLELDMSDFEESDSKFMFISSEDISDSNQIKAGVSFSRGVQTSSLDTCAFYLELLCESYCGKSKGYLVFMNFQNDKWVPFEKVMMWD